MSTLGTPSQLFQGTAEQVAARMSQLRLGCVQLSPGFSGLRFIEPAQFTPDRCRAAAHPFLDKGIQLAALSFGADLQSEDLHRRHSAIIRLHTMIRASHCFGTPNIVVELSAHDTTANDAANFSSDVRPTELRFILRQCTRIARDHGVTLLLRGSTHRRLPSPPKWEHLIAECVDDNLQLVPELGGVNQSLESWPPADGVGDLPERRRSRTPLVHFWWTPSLRNAANCSVNPDEECELTSYVHRDCLQQVNGHVILRNIHASEIATAYALINPLLGPTSQQCSATRYATSTQRT